MRPDSNECGVFPATRWSQVLAAKGSSAVEACAALESLCRAYWAPIYWFIRRDGKSVSEAQDLTQDFFVRLVERDFLSHLRHQDGRFRSFLLAFLKNFLIDARRYDNALKRGGGHSIISLDELADEEREQLSSPAALRPDAAFDRRWGLAVLRRAFQRLHTEYQERGDGRLFDAVKDLAPRERGPVSYTRLSSELGMTESALKSAIFRLRQRHQQLIREEIAQTVAHPGEIDTEIRCLLAIFSGE